MRRFSFSLEKVLELRRYRERQWEHKLAEVTGRVVAVDREIREWQAERSVTTAYHTLPGRLDMSRLWAREDYLGRVESRLLELRSRRAGLETELAKVREDYLAASSARKALSRLEERRRDEYYRAALKDENRTLDEIGGTLKALSLADLEGEHV